MSKSKILDVRIVHDGWSKFMIADVCLADGARARREIEDHGCAVAVLPYDAVRRTVVLVSQMRAPVLYATGADALIEAVAGMIDDGETADVSARRETMEEAGLRLGELEALGKVWVSPGISTERISLFLAPYALADRVAEGGGLAAEHEGVTVLELPAAEAWDRLQAGGIADMKTLALLYALKLRHPELFTPA